MLTAETRHAIHQDQAKGMETAALRQHFLAEDFLQTAKFD